GNAVSGGAMASSSSSALHAMEQPEYHIDLDAYTLSISGDVPDFLYTGSIVASPSARVRLTGSDQSISGLYAFADLEIPGSVRESASSCG
ncbi:MAG: hypothetical protein ACMG55_10035, partial [Microcoleus sp.]